jgi:hypothetical protein
MQTKFARTGKAVLSCATRRTDGMDEKSHWLYQGVGEPLGLSRTGHSVSVRSMPLKGTGEAEASRQDARLGCGIAW